MARTAARGIAESDCGGVQGRRRNHRLHTVCASPLEELTAVRASARLELTPSELDRVRLIENPEVPAKR